MTFLTEVRGNKFTRRDARRAAFFAVAYFAAYLGYLFWHPEGELLHWLTLVILPASGLAVLTRARSLRALAESIGLVRSNATQGLWLALLLGVAFQILQLLNARQREEVLVALGGPWGFVLPLAAFALLVGTAATTEEVFFRGILQLRVTEYWQSEVAGLAVATAAFVLYHVPYAYLKTSWPSHGHLDEAFQLAAVNGLLGGVSLGCVFWYSRHNLAASICLHAFINLIPAIRLVGRLL